LINNYQQAILLSLAAQIQTVVVLAKLNLQEIAAEMQCLTVLLVY
jgi:hypothetical protein